MADRIILASRSPQRRHLMAGLGISFSVDPSTVDELACAENDPALRAVCLAEKKARDVHKRHAGAPVIGCDTLVVAPDGTLLEKPADAKDARRMLLLQSGGCSTVHSAVCLVAPDGAVHSGLSSSRVYFKELLIEEIDAWLRTGLWEGRSGAFQIDGPGQLMIARIEGDWTGIVGLPVYLLGDLLGRIGIRLL